MKDFINAILNNGGVDNDESNVWVTLEGRQYSIYTEEVIKKEEYPFQASEILETDFNNHGWELLYNKYLNKDGLLI